jgi:CubicO group peptidase (beta-lactamase class C family)
MEAALRETVGRFVAETGAVGAVVGYGQAGCPSVVVGAGRSAVDADAAPSSSTLFRIGSVTKTFTATAVMRLHQLGRLALDDPLAAHVPEAALIRNPFGPVDQITIRRLLSHRSGLQGEAPLPYWETLRFPDESELLDSLDGVGVVVAPGEVMKYSNLGYALLGAAISRASGVAYTDFVTDEILSPLGLTDTLFMVDASQRSRLATGYDKRRFCDLPTPAPMFDLGALASAGQLFSTAADLLRWGAFHNGEIDGVLSPATMAVMHHPEHLTTDWESGTCLGWGAVRKHGHVVLAHEGGLHGFSSVIMVMPARQATIVVLVNDSFSGASALAMETLSVALQAAPAVPTPSSTPYVGPAERASLPQFRALTGWYLTDSVPSMVDPVTIATTGDHLVVLVPIGGSGPVEFKLAPTESPTDFTVIDGRWIGECLSFEHDGDAVIGFEVGGFRFSRLSAGAGRP